MFYGWAIVGVTFVTRFVMVGTIYYSYGILYKPMAEDLDASRMQIAWALPLLTVVSAAASPLIGRMVDRGAARSVMMVGAVFATAGFFTLSRAETLWQFYFAFAVPLGLGASLLGGLVNNSLITNWFIVRRGMALGLSSIGVSAAGVVMVFVVTAMVEQIGWRGAVQLLAFVPVVVVLPLVWAVIVSRPEEKGLLPDGATRSVAPSTTESQKDGSPWAKGRMLYDRNLWVIAGMLGFNFAGQGSMIQQIVPHATDLGYTAKQAATILSVMAAMGMAGKLLFGSLGDRLHPRVAAWLCLGTEALGLALVLAATSHLSLVIAAGIFGLGSGGFIPLYALVVGATYGRRAFGRAVGAIRPLTTPFHLASMPFSGWIYDRTGSYELAFLVFIGCFGIAAALTLLLRLPEVEPDRAGDA